MYDAVLQCGGGLPCANWRARRTERPAFRIALRCIAARCVALCCCVAVRCTMQCNTIQYNSKQYETNSPNSRNSPNSPNVLYWVVLLRVESHCVALRCIALCPFALRNLEGRENLRNWVRIALRGVVLYCGMLYCIVLCCGEVCNAMRYNTKSSNAIQKPTAPTCLDSRNSPNVLCCIVLWRVVA